MYMNRSRYPHTEWHTSKCRQEILARKQAGWSSKLAVTLTGGGQCRNVWEDNQANVALELRLQDPTTKYTKSFLIILSLNAHRDRSTHPEIHKHTQKWQAGWLVYKHTHVCRAIKRVGPWYPKTLRKGTVRTNRKRKRKGPWHKATFSPNCFISWNGGKIFRQLCVCIAPGSLTQAMH